MEPDTTTRATNNHPNKNNNNVNSNNSTIDSGGLVWNNLSVCTHNGTFLLKNCNGRIPNGQLCGLLGPSGAGKSTMLSALGGTLVTQGSTYTSSSSTTTTTTTNTTFATSMNGTGGLRMYGDIFYVDSTTTTSTTTTRATTTNETCHCYLDIQSGKVAWLPQKDHFFNMLTVQETLQLAAFLELPDCTPVQRQYRIQTVMDSLGLTQLQHRRIGEQESGLWHNGLSGGEKRRLSLAVELVANPKLFLGDEPTTGLDSTLSEKVVKLIKKLVVEKEHIPCLLSLHQPRSSIWRMLDSVILLAPGGRVCYMGSTDEALPYFANLGYHCPPETNPAEFLLDLVSIDTEESIQVASKDEARIERLAVAFFDQNNDNDSNNKNDKGLFRVPSTFQNTVAVRPTRRRDTSPSVSWTVSIPRKFSRFGKLLQRAWRQNIRNHQVNAVRLVVSAGNAYFFTNVFASVQKGRPYTVQTVPDRTALLSFGVINMAMMTVMKTIDLFAKEKPVVLREQQRRQYSSLEYLLSKTLAEIPLDAVFAVIFTTVLKSCSGVRIGWWDLTAVFSLMTLCGASLGFAIGACTPTGEMALSVGVPLMVLLLGVGVITPSGGTKNDAIADYENEHPSFFVTILKQLSPIAYAIRAVCIAEYDGMELSDPHSELHRRRGIFTPIIVWIRTIRSIFRLGGLALVQRGDQILEELGIGDDTYGGSMMHLTVLSMLFLLIAWIGLSLQQRGPHQSRS
ncbi:ABC transporter ATP-binding protein [Nitzschia inconspicua]|uniref:ABC transporter ATP-binding protein n=1 Tax=Nitzschia inconspicua TaxID=303405 RepID=A0A9K3PIV9_9STRA|nr:ABC transporter ATP-binding protein [Nitzschia inconspicua]